MLPSLQFAIVSLICEHHIPVIRRICSRPKFRPRRRRRTSQSERQHRAESHAHNNPKSSVKRTVHHHSILSNPIPFTKLLVVRQYEHSSNAPSPWISAALWAPALSFLCSSSA